MLNNIEDILSVYNTTAQNTTSIPDFLLCLLVSLILGALIAISYMYKNRYTQSFVITLALLPAIVQVVIMLVNGNLGTGIAVMGAFSLVRFRSIPGTAKEIGSIFLSMSVGLATGTGFIGTAFLFTTIMILVIILYTKINFGINKNDEKELKITIPEGLDYNDIFNDIFKKYTDKADLFRVKTSNMGSLFQLHYLIELKNPEKEKELIDSIRCRNGNLDIICSKVAYGNGEL